LGNAKLKHLDPEAQKHFGFNSAKARDLELKQREANAQFRTNFAQGRIGEYSTANLPGSRRVQEQADPEPQLDSGQRTSLVGQQAPELVVEKWLTLAPDTSRKFVLIEFLGTWCGACRRSIPLLNSISEEYEDRLVVIGVSAEREIDVRNQKSPRINYAVAIDSKQRTYRAAGVRAIPHVLLIDPRGVVRYAGSPSSFEDRRILEKILDKYAD
jgi:thiol-disulfide isomerase/thioredoxin